MLFFQGLYVTLVTQVAIVTVTIVLTLVHKVVVSICISIHVKYPLFLSSFNDSWYILAYSTKNPKFRISHISV